MDKIILILILISLIGCGDGDNHKPVPQPPPTCVFTYSEWGECQPDGTQARIATPNIKGCFGEPITVQTCEYVPPVTDCCPNPTSALLCEQCADETPCLTEHPLIKVNCLTTYEGVAQWIIRIDWGIATIRVDKPSCCAEFLLAQGARLDLFAAAMLGKLDVVKAVLSAFPEAIDTPGPHGIPLIAHAKAGGEQAKDVLVYLESLQSK